MNSTEDIRRALREWERLRVIYNVVMLVFGTPAALLMCSAYDQIGVGVSEFIVLIIVAGVLANLLYCLGPMLDVYRLVFWGTGFESRTRKCVFAVGLLLSLLMIPVVLVGGVLAQVMPH
jgi:hypothetical protein